MALKGRTLRELLTSVTSFKQPLKGLPDIDELFAKSRETVEDVAKSPLSENVPIEEKSTPAKIDFYSRPAPTQKTSEYVVNPRTKVEKSLEASDSEKNRELRKADTSNIVYNSASALDSLFSQASFSFEIGAIEKRLALKEASVMNSIAMLATDYENNIYEAQLDRANKATSLAMSSSYSNMQASTNNITVSKALANKVARSKTEIANVLLDMTNQQVESSVSIFNSSLSMIGDSLQTLGRTGSMYKDTQEVKKAVKTSSDIEDTWEVKKAVKTSSISEDVFSKSSKR